MEIDDDKIKVLKWSAAEEAVLRGPYDYLKNQAGKELRTLLVTQFNEILKVSQDKVKEIVSLIDILHTSSLLVDDVEDHANLRRGKPAGHLIFGIPTTINSANYMYFILMEKCVKLSPNSFQIFLEEMINLHRGQGLDLYWRESFQCPTEDQYVNMVMNKTGGLFRLAVRLLQDNSNSGVDLIPFLNLLGVVYQIRDDYLNLSAYEDNKGYCEDITEGKFSFPIIHSIRNSSNQELMNILKLRTDNNDLKKYAVELMEKTTATFEYCEQTLKNMQVKGNELLDELHSTETSNLQILLESLCKLNTSSES